MPAGATTLDWILLALSVAIVIVVIVLAVRYFLRPGETSPDHIKRQVLRSDLDTGDA